MFFFLTIFISMIRSDHKKGDTKWYLKGKRNYGKQKSNSIRSHEQC